MDITIPDLKSTSFLSKVQCSTDFATPLIHQCLELHISYFDYLFFFFFLLFRYWLSLENLVCTIYLCFFFSNRSLVMEKLQTEYMQMEFTSLSIWMVIPKVLVMNYLLFVQPLSRYLCFYFSGVTTMPNLARMVLWNQSILKWFYESKCIILESNHS